MHPIIKFELPLTQAQAPDSLAGKHADTKLRVLVVEDHLNTLQLLSEILTGNGCQVHACSTGEEALKHLGEVNFDILFTDVSLPGISGITLAQEYRSRHPNIKIILASGYEVPASQYLPQPCYYLTKPFSIEQINNLLKEIEAGIQR